MNIGLFSACLMDILVPSNRINFQKQIAFNKRYYLFPIVVLSNFVISLFSPLVAFYMGVFFLLACSRYIDRTTVKWLGYVCAYAGSVIVASRKTFDPSDDFRHYYEAYTHIVHAGWPVVLDQYGTEIGLPIYYFLLSGLGITNQVFPLFAVSMLSSSLFVLWLNKFGSKNFPVERFGTLMAISLLFYSFVMATQVTRQMIALSFLLFAISVVGWRSAAWLFCALLFHQSSLLIYLAFKLVKRFSLPTAVLIVSFGFAFMLNFNQIAEIAIASGLDFIRVASKFAYYAISDESYSDVDISGLKFVSLSCVAALLSAKYMPQGWGVLILYVGIFYVLLLPFPLVSLRTFMIFVAVLAGYMATFLAFRVGWVLISLFAFAYGIYTLFKQFNPVVDYPLQLWVKFDWIGYFPAYYFLDQ